MAVDFRAIFSAQDKVSGTLNGIEKSGSGLTSTFKKLAGAAAGVFTAAKVVQFGKETVSAFTNFESGMNEVFTLLPGISGDAMDEMSQQVKAFAKENGVLTDEAIPAVYQAISAGVSKDNVFDFLTTANKAAVGGVTNLETAVDGLTTVVNSYGSDTMDVNTASDLMFTTVKLGKTTFEELSASLYNVLPTASAAGISFQDVSAALATITAQGVPTATATTQLRQAFVELSDTGSEVGKTFKTVAGKSFKEFIASGGNTQDALQLLEQYAKKSNVGVNELFSSVEAGNAALSLTGNATDKFSAALEEMGAASGATDTAFAKMEESFSRKIDKLKAKFDVLKVNIGDKLVGAILEIWDKAEPVFTQLEGALQSVATFVQSNWSTIAPIIVGIVSAMTAYKVITLATSAVETARIAIMELQTGTTLSAVAAQLGLNTAMLASPVTWLAIGIGAVVAAGILLWKNWDKVKAKATELWDSVKSTFAPVGQFFSDMWDAIKAPFIAAAEWFMNTVITPIVAVFSPIVSKIGEIFSTIWQIITAVFGFAASWFGTTVIQPVIGLFSQLWASIAAIFSSVGSWFGARFSEAWEAIKAVFAPVGAFFAGIWETVKAQFSKIGSAVGDAFSGAFKAVVNAILKFAENKINGFINAINTVVGIVNKIPGVNISKITPLTIPMLAKGTFDAPNTFIAGEKGPELITGAQGSRVFPSDETDRIMSALDRANQPIDVSDNPVQASDDDSDSDGGTKTFNININGSGQISGNGMTEDEVLEIMIVHLRPILMKIIKAEIYEEGNASYEF